MTEKAEVRNEMRGPLDRIARSARRTLRGEAGIVTIRVGNEIRFVGRDNTSIERVPPSWSVIDRLMGDEGYGFTDRGRDDERLAGNPAFDAYPELQSIFACEVPAPFEFGRSFLIVLSSARMPTPDARQVVRARELAELAGDIVALSASRTGPGDDPGSAPGPSGVTGLAASMIEQAPFAGALLTAEGRFLFVNEAKAALNGVSKEEHVGALVGEVAPQNEALVRELIDRITRTGQPVLDECVDAGDPADRSTFRSFSISAFPVHGEDAIVAFSTFMTDVTERRWRELTDASQPGLPPGMSERSPDPAANFLVSTLVRRESMRTRGAVSYLTCRAWRKSVKDSQIAALRALKRDPPEHFVATLAGEIVDLVCKTTGTGAFESVVPVPCGSSGTAQCLSVRVGRAVAARIGAACVEPFEPRLRGGSSHPRRNASLTPLKLRSQVDGPCLIVDDVATSGRHIEQVSEALRDSAGDQFRVAWIGS